MIDVERYMARIGFLEKIDINLHTLSALHRHHAFSIPFENFSVYLDGKVSLEKEDIQEKLIGKRRGGYCYEQNGLFHDLLNELGFDVEFLTSRPMYGHNEFRPKTHMILKINLEGKTYLADLGFTGLSVVEPIEIVDSTQVSSCSQQHRITTHPDRGFILQLCTNGRWDNLFSFDLEKQEYIDFKLANYFNSHSPESIFTQQLIAALYTPSGRIRLVDDILKFRLNDRTEDVSLDTLEKFSTAVVDTLRIPLDPSSIRRLYDFVQTKKAV